MREKGGGCADRVDRRAQAADASDQQIHVQRAGGEMAGGKGNDCTSRCSESAGRSTSSSNQQRYVERAGERVRSQGGGGGCAPPIARRVLVGRCFL